MLENFIIATDAPKFVFNYLANCITEKKWEMSIAKRQKIWFDIISRRNVYLYTASTSAREAEQIMTNIISWAHISMYIEDWFNETESDLFIIWLNYLIEKKNVLNLMELLNLVECFFFFFHLLSLLLWKFLKIAQKKNSEHR